MNNLLREGAVLFLWQNWEQRDAMLVEIKKHSRLLESLKAENPKEIRGLLSLFPDDKFNAIFVCQPDLPEELLALALAKLLPAGRLIQLAHAELTGELQGRLVLNGYVKLHMENGCVVAEKPNYAASSAMLLSFGKKLTEQKAKVAAVWTIDNDDEDDVIDADELLDEEDLAKPDPASNRVCGTTGKRKACKDCSCGLADELDNERKPKVDPNQKSSCGSCYLGDAFRCASCPYAGMPAFKPGQKIQLNDNFLDAS